MGLVFLSEARSYNSTGKKLVGSLIGRTSLSADNIRFLKSLGYHVNKKIKYIPRANHG